MAAKGWMTLWLAIVGTMCGSCAYYAHYEPVDGWPAENAYTRYNLHYISEMGLHRASYANWTQHVGHRVLPYNTRVQATFHPGGIEFLVADTGMRIGLAYNARHMGMSAWDYFDLITSPTPVTYDDLSAVDRQGITAGRARPGMSKQGVLIALGYPAPHMTPSLDENHWVYWKARRGSYAVLFDPDGNVTRLVDQ